VTDRTPSIAVQQTL